MGEARSRHGLCRGGRQRLLPLTRRLHRDPRNGFRQSMERRVLTLPPYYGVTGVSTSYSLPRLLTLYSFTSVFSWSTGLSSVSPRRSPSRRDLRFIHQVREGEGRPLGKVMEGVGGSCNDGSREVTIRERVEKRKS